MTATASSTRPTFGFANAGPESFPLAGRWAPFVRWRPGFYTGDGDIAAGDDVFVLADASHYFPKRRVRFATFLGPGVPLIGDWNGDLFDELGKVVGTRFILDMDANDRWDGVATDRNTSFAAAFGIGEPIRGRWVAGGPERIGVYVGDVFRLDRNGNGIWNGNGPALDRAIAIAPGAGPGTPFVCDWNGDGEDDVAKVVGATWYVDFNGNGSWDGEGGGDRETGFAPDPDGIPIAGRWTVP